MDRKTLEVKKLMKQVDEIAGESDEDIMGQLGKDSNLLTEFQSPFEILDSLHKQVQKGKEIVGN